ncbi:hypothetical protein GOEFS_081_00370 [Gordonia effusa NBRC 100432]|uniref:LppM domain-containing protein n=1 Tax=Gordonia effusa NBRC 100432 TaxID=1077974 RepID=H0R2P6_9ACTN|nr:hypothetical protein [Gordonia effusa]GAB19347.1 hypothetical protein GOEFS_081_00370 [Gordonia effusa NBRC 100432]
MSRRVHRKTALPVAALVALLALSGLLSGCMTRSTTVGDRFAGEIIVATSPDNPRGAPNLDIPQSMASHITVAEYKETDKSGDQTLRIGTRAYYSDLTSGQFSQLADIIAGAYDNSNMSMEISGKRSGDIVRMRGTADLSDLVAQRDQIRLIVTFNGPVIASNGEQTGSQTVAWNLPIGKSGTLNADAQYPDPATAAISSWAWFLGIVCVIAVGLIGYIAFRNRDAAPRPGAPARAGKKPETDSTNSGPVSAGKK